MSQTLMSSISGDKLVLPSRTGMQHRQQRVTSVTVKAIFGKKASSTVTVEKPKEEPKPFSFFRQTTTKPKGKATTSTPANKAEDLKKRQGIFGNVTSALDFAEVRSKNDAELLWDAKYGERGADGRMSREQYRALRRKIGGTAKDYWKDWVDVKGKYVEKGYVSTEQTQVPGLPFLLATVALMFVALGYVVAATS